MGVVAASFDGRVRAGAAIDRQAGEWGHMVIDPAGPLPLLRAHAVAWSIHFWRWTGIALRDHWRSLHAQAIFAGGCWSLPAAAIDDFHKALRQALANLITVPDPTIRCWAVADCSNVESSTRSGVAEVAKRVFSDELTTPIVRNALGDSAGGRRRPDRSLR